MSCDMKVKIECDFTPPVTWSKVTPPTPDDIMDNDVILGCQIPLLAIFRLCNVFLSRAS